MRRSPPLPSNRNAAAVVLWLPLSSRKLPLSRLAPSSSAGNRSVTHALTGGFFFRARHKLDRMVADGWVTRRQL